MPESSNEVFHIAMAVSDEPATYGEATLHDNTDLWQEAVNEKVPYISAVGSLIQRGDDRDMQLHGYCNADRGGDYGTRRSKTGYVLSMNDGHTSWYSKQQQAAALSSTEAAYVAAGQAGREALWLRQLLRDRHRQQAKPTAIARAALPWLRVP